MAQDQTNKRRNIAANAVIASTNFVNALNALLALKDERLQAGDFVDADFDGTAGGLELEHLTPGIIGTLFDFVVPSLSTNYTDAANGNRNMDILLQMRR